MSVSGITSVVNNLTQGTTNSSISTNSDGGFSAILNSLGNGTPFTDAQVKEFFAQNPSVQAIAEKAKDLALTKDQITQALATGGYADPAKIDIGKEVENFVSTLANGFAWNGQGKLTDSKVAAQGVSGIGSDKSMPSAADIKNFYATGPTPDQVTAKVKALGLNAAQMVQFEATGLGANVNKMNAATLESMYVDAANRLGTDIGGGKNGGWTSYFSPTLGRAVTRSELQSFFDTKPNQKQIFAKASELGLGLGAITNMMVGLGVSKSENLLSDFGDMAFNLFKGSEGFSRDDFGRIVAGGGHTWSGSSADNGTWVPFAAGTYQT